MFLTCMLQIRTKCVQVGRFTLYQKIEPQFIPNQSPDIHHRCSAIGTFINKNLAYLDISLLLVRQETKSAMLIKKNVGRNHSSIIYSKLQTQLISILLYMTKAPDISPVNIQYINEFGSGFCHTFGYIFIRHTSISI